jgi:hypothetical protein
MPPHVTLLRTEQYYQKTFLKSKNIRITNNQLIMEEFPTMPPECADISAQRGAHKLD